MRLHWIVAATLVAALAGCSKGSEGEAPAGSGSTSMPVVYSVNYPLFYFAKRIGGAAFEVVFPTPTGVDPAYWKPGPEEVAAYQAADLILLNGAAYARWVPMVSLPASKLRSTADGFQDRWIPLEHAVTHSHGPGGEHAHGDTAFTTWLDPTLAVQQAAAVRDALVELKPGERARLDAAFEALASDLGALDEALQAAVARAPQQPVVFSHPVYQYLERRYGIRGRSVHWEPDEAPEPPAWRDLEKLRASHPVGWMIWEGEPQGETLDRLAELGIQSAVFDPCGSRPEDGDYLAVMRKNAEELARVFSGGQISE